MRQSKFTETQIVSILKEADAGRPVNEIWRSYGISSATYYKWKAKYGWARGLRCEAAEGIGTREQPAQTDVRRSLAGECGAEGCPRKKALRPAERREVVAHLVTERGLPVQRACRGGGPGSGDVLPAPRGLGPAGCTGDRGADDARGREESLGLLEVLRSTPARWASVESQAVVAGLLPASLELATTDEEAAPGSVPPAARRGAAAQCRLGGGLHE